MIHIRRATSYSPIDLFDLCDNALIAYIAQYAHPAQLCLLLTPANRRIWRLIEKPKRMRADPMLAHAAFGGHSDLCELAIAHGATDFDGMLVNAASGGHRDICELAIVHGATNFKWMLAFAAKHGHRDICELAIAHDATNFNCMLANAIRGEHPDICSIAISHGAKRV